MRGTENRRGSFDVVGRCVVAVLVAALSGAGQADAAGVGLRRFQCFEVKRHAFATRQVTIVDAFSSGTASVERPERLCEPADVNDRDPGAPTDPGLLTGYPAKHEFVPVFDQAVVTEFGTIVIDVLPPDRLLVPTGKAPAAPPPDLDHFECYRLRLDAPFTPVPHVKVDDPFGTATVSLRRPLRLCVPADKNGESSGAETHRTGLLCYQTRSRVTFPEFDVVLQNQFGTQDALLIRRMELCVPATWGPSTSTTTVTTSTTTTSATTTHTSTTMPGVTTTTKPGVTSTSSTTSSVTITFGTTVTSTSGPGATSTTTTSSTSTTIPTSCSTPADCPQTTCLTPACTNGVCIYSPILDCPLCTPGPELCGNGKDDDCDNLVDCHDPDCTGAAGCSMQEVCGDCLDNDDDGLVDFEDPDCCAQTLTLDVHLLRLRFKPSRHSPDRVRLRSIWAPAAPDGFDPMKQDTSVQIRDACGELFCKTINAMHFMPMHGSVGFWDRKGEFAGGLSDGRFTVRRSQAVDFRTHGPAPDLGTGSAGPVRVTVRVGGRCSQTSGTLRSRRNALVVRPARH